MSIVPITFPPKKLLQTISASATQFKLNNIKQWNGTDLTPADFGTEAYGVFIDSTRTQIEVFKFDPDTIADEYITIIARGLPYTGGDTEMPENKFAWPSNDTTVQLGTDAPQLFRDFITESNTATITVKHTYTELPESAVTPVDADDLTRKGYVDYKAITAKAIIVDQVAHGFSTGDIVRLDGTNTYVLAQADTPEHAEVAGVVTEVHDVDSFSYTTEGLVTVGVPAVAAKTTLFLSPTVAGTFTATEPTAVGQISAPLGVVLENGVAMNFHRHRPYIVGGSYTNTLPAQLGNGGKFLKTDGSDALWETIPGGGNLLSSNNLSDVDSAATARQNLGLEIGVDVQAYDARIAGVLTGRYPVVGTPTTDLTANGPYTETFVAGENLTALDLVYLKSDGKWWKSDADAVSTSGGLLGIAMNAATANATASVQLHGSFVRKDAWTWTHGDILYVSTNPGEITATAPVGSGDVVRVVGTAVSQDVIYFTPSPNHYTLV
jgi:hypothetical protein